MMTGLNSNPILTLLSFLQPGKGHGDENKLGADIIMAFDICSPYPCDYEDVKRI